MVEIASGGANRSGQIILNNEGTTDATIEIKVSRVDLGENGEQSHVPAPSDLVVFPPQKIVPAKSSQVFKIQWAGPPLQRSQTYALEVLQPQVKLPNAPAGVQISYDFEVIVNVAPPSGTTSITLGSASVTTSDTRRLVRLVVSNTGTMHALFSDATVVLKSGAWSRTLTAPELHRLIGVGIVQPQHTRRFLLPIDLPKDVTALSAEITLNKAMH